MAWVYDENTGEWNNDGAITIDPMESSTPTVFNPAKDSQLAYDTINNGMADPMASGVYNPAVDSQNANVAIDAANGPKTAIQGYTVPSNIQALINAAAAAAGKSTSPLTALNKLLGTNVTGSDISSWAPLLGGVLGASGLGKATTNPVGYQGKVPTMTATRTQLPVANVRPYGGAAQGQQYFSPTTYTRHAARGGIMSLAEGGLTEGGFVVPADVVSHLGNGSSSAGLALLMQRMGAQPIKGAGDGMSDSIATSIDGQRPAKVANDEAYLPPDRVAALGGGDMKKGSQKLYALMDRIRQERTGSTAQGKQINPNHFLPGGAVHFDGGVEHFDGGGTPNAMNTAASNPGVTGIESNLSNWAGDYVTNMLGKGQALANQPYQAYTGQLTAGTSPTSQQAYGQATNWQPQSSVTQASNTLGQIANTDATPYTPGQIASQYQAPTPYTPGQIASQYQAPTAYNASNIGTGTFDNSAAQQYMNPYLQQSLAPQVVEAQRQASIQEMQNRARLAKAGAYGGSRQAIMESEGNRNLQTNLANITGQGYTTAYNNAQSQFNADQSRSLQAQQANEASRQFGAGQAQTAAQQNAQYGMTAQQANEASRQFGAGQAQTAAQQNAQYGMTAQQANEASRQFGSSRALQDTQQQLAAAQSQGNMGLSLGNQGLAALQQLGTFGQQQQQTEQAALDAQKAQFEAERDNPYKMVQYQQSLLQGLPLAAQNYAAATPSALQETISGAGGVAGLMKLLGFTDTTTPPPA